MPACEKTCIKCNDTHALIEFLSSHRSYVHKTCRSCRYETWKTWRLRKNNIARYTCQGDSCPDTIFKNNKALHRINGDGLLVCVGCLRIKTRKGKNDAIRRRIQDFCSTRRCVYCDLSCNKHLLTFDYFDLINENANVITYSRLLRCGETALDNILSASSVTRIACLNCIRDKITSYVR